MFKNKKLINRRMQNINDYIILFQILIATKILVLQTFQLVTKTILLTYGIIRKNNSSLNTIFLMHLSFPEILCFLYNTRNAAEEHITFKF